MKKIAALVIIVAAILCIALPASATGESVVFSGNFDDVTFFTGMGSKEKLLNGITATDPSTGEDITDKIEILGTIDFNKVGVYKVSYSVVDGTGTSWGKLRKVSVVELDQDVVYKNVNHGRNYLESIDFEMIKNTGYRLSYDLYTENYEKLLYSWTFTGEDIYNPPRRMSVTITGESENYEDIKARVGQANFQILNFEYRNRFPSKADILFLVDESIDKDSTLYLYSYGATEGFKLIADGITINSANYSSYGFMSGNEYVLTDKKVGYSENTASQYSAITSSVPVKGNESGDVPEGAVNPNFNTAASEASDENSYRFDETTRRIFYAVIITAFSIMLFAFLIFILTKSRKKGE